LSPPPTMTDVVHQVLACGVLLLAGAVQSVPQQPAGQPVWKPDLFPSVQSLLSRRSGRPFTITVEGNVGSGKSTLLEFFQQYPDISVYPEPVSTWTNLNGTDFLGLVYKNPARWGMTFESLVQLSMLEEHVRDLRGRGHEVPVVKIMERSFESCRFCFVEQLRETAITPVEFTVLDSWYKLVTERPEFDTAVDVIIYLRTVPEVIYQRVAKRSRKEEMTIPLEYYQQMHRLHEDWLIHKNSTGSTNLPPILVIDANHDISVLSPTYRRLAKDIYKSIPEELKTYKYFNRPQTTTTTPKSQLLYLDQLIEFLMESFDN